MALDKLINKSDVIQSYKWLGHQECGYTELLAVHPAYKYGKENYEHNIKNKAFPKIWYAKSEKQILAFLSKYHGSHLCCYGINPRTKVLKNKRGYPKRASNSDIEVVNNFYIDIDFSNNLDKKKQLKEFDDILEEIDSYLIYKDIQKPVRAFTGNGYHLLFPLPSIEVRKYTDIGDRLNIFLKEIHDKFSTDIGSIGAKIDKTTDLARVAKIYGTRKPEKTQVSRFYGKERIEDVVLLEYLLILPIENNFKKGKSLKNEIQIDTYESLPQKFIEILEKDKELSDLWNGINKDLGDTTKSGYDMSLMYACIKRGITDVKTLATILSKRTNGSLINSNKGDEYIRLTITKALQTSSW
jgi:hypothetical protein